MISIIRLAKAILIVALCLLVISSIFFLFVKYPFALFLGMMVFCIVVCVGLVYIHLERRESKT